MRLCLPTCVTLKDFNDLLFCLADKKDQPNIFLTDSRLFEQNVKTAPPSGSAPDLLESALNCQTRLKSESKGVTRCYRALRADTSA